MCNRFSSTDNAQLVRSTGANVSVMILLDCKSSPQKSRPLESVHRRHGVWLAIEYSYKLGQKMKLNFRLVFAETVTYICDRICEKGSYTRIQFFNFKEA